METEKLSMTSTELVDALAKVRPVVRNILMKATLGADLDDVMQDVWLSAHRSQSNFDPEKGRLEQWLTRIAQRRAYDHLKLSNSVSGLQSTLEDAAGYESGTDLALVSADVAEDIVNRSADRDLLSKILMMTRKVIGHEAAFTRTVALLTVYDEDVRAAALGLRVSEDCIRDSRRETIRASQVIQKALALHEIKASLNLRNLFACLPSDEGDSGTWARHLTIAVVRCGGFQNVNAESLVEVTGWAFNTCRQYLNETRRLLEIARTVIETGRVDHEPSSTSRE